jgi:hypothetical protein
MAIVVRPDEASPLSQGDILRKVPFAVTDADGNLAAEGKATYLMVIARPCNALRDAALTVAPIVPFPVDLSVLNESKSESGPSLDRMRRILAGIRDGGQFSDTFYLGTLEPSSKRFAAQLSTLSTIQVPVKPDERAAWIKDRRVWRLHEDFVKDLHLRLFVAFARLGFDDYAWFADADLAVMITAGESEVAGLKMALTEAERAVQAKEALNQQVPEAQKKAIETRRVAVQEAEQRLRPYQEEQARRQPLPAAQGE